MRSQLKAQSTALVSGIGSVLLPARDGTLRSLGHNIEELGLRALGLVIESRNGKCLVFFPELKMTLWLSKNEVADIFERAHLGEQEFSKLLPQKLDQQTSLIWWLSHLCRSLPVTVILGVEVAPLGELWDGQLDELAKYYSGDLNTRTAYIGLGLPELVLSKWQEIEKSLGDKLLFARFLPAGMHKLEVAVYLRA